MGQLRRPPQHALREVFTGPVEDSATGASASRSRRARAAWRSRGSGCEFSAGRVVEARAERGDAYLRETLATDPGATRLGEIGIGTNFGIDRPMGTILFDEKIGGTVHLAVGRSYPETGGVNEWAVHWDMICDLRDGGRVSADGVAMIETGALWTVASLHADWVCRARHGCRQRVLAAALAASSWRRPGCGRTW